MAGFQLHDTKTPSCTRNNRIFSFLVLSGELRRLRVEVNELKRLRANWIKMKASLNRKPDLLELLEALVVSGDLTEASIQHYTKVNVIKMSADPPSHGLFCTSAVWLCAIGWGTFAGG